MQTNHADGIGALIIKPSEKEVIAAFLQDQARHHKERRRAVRRFRFLDPTGMVVRVLHPGGTTAPYRVTPRDLSELGMGFLHGNFLYPGSHCRIDLRGKDGEIRKVNAKIIRCNHVTGRIHDIGIEFDEPVDPALYVDMEALPDDRPANAGKAKPSYWKSA